MPDPASPTGTARFAAALHALVEELDWDRLGDVYCDEGGASFFPPEQRDAIVDAGLLFAADVGARLAALRAPARSLYFGAAVAEIVPILFEALVLERDVVWHNLDGDELREIERARVACEARVGFALPSMSVSDGPLRGPFGHVWCVSVLTDPTAFPAFHDELYERHGTELATGRGDVDEDRTRARLVVDQLLDSASRPALLTTTDDELAVFRAGLDARGLQLAIPEQGRLSPIVGDVVRLCELSAT